MDLLDAITEKQKIINENIETDKTKIIPQLKSLTNKFINSYTDFKPTFNNIYYMKQIVEQFSLIRNKNTFGSWKYISKDNMLSISSRQKTPKKISANSSIIFGSKIVGGKKAIAKLKYVKSGGKIEYTGMNEEMRKECILTILKEYLLDPFFCISINEEKPEPTIYKELCNLI